MKSLIVALALIAPGLAGAQNIVRNGSFEETNQPSGTWNVYNTITGWSTLQGPGIEVRDNVAGTAYDGSNFVELDSHSNSWMGQTLTTTAGVDYILSFFYSPRMGVAAASNGIDVLWGNSLLNASPITGNGVGLTNNSWTQYSFTVRGTGSDLLSFRAVGISDSYGGSLDAVRVIAAPVPEPETYAMLLAGLMFVGFVMRRRQA
jgi:hypothetical protein